MYIPPEPMRWNYCPTCGGHLAVKDDGESARPHCVRCRRFFYSNPVPASCCFVMRRDALLLAKRAIEPCLGEWTLPGGFVEVGETTEEAALRELREETGLVGKGTRLIGVNTQMSRLSGAVTVLGYLVEPWEGELTPGSDAADLGFFKRDEFPALAFEAHRRLLAEFDSILGRNA